MNSIIKKLNWVAISLCVLLSSNAFAQIVLNEINLGEDDFIELKNSGPLPVDLTGYVMNVRDPGFPTSIDFAFPSTIVQPDGAVRVVGENPRAGEIDFGQNISFHYTRNLSLTLRDPGNTVIDFWAHGNPIADPPPGVTMTPGPLTSLTFDSNQVTYHRITVTKNGLEFFASDWKLGQATRGHPGLSVPIPTLSVWGLIALCLALMVIAAPGVRRFKIHQANK